jgi:acyl-CoA ligase (AMP-forming) (exosortase A-associated)
MADLLSLLHETANRVPEKTALIHKAHKYSYAQLWRNVEAFAALFSRAGVMPGDRVAVWLPKQVEMVASLWAANHVGAVFIPVNPALKPQQVGHILADSGAAMLVTSAQRLAALEQSGVFETVVRPKIFVVEDKFPADETKTALHTPDADELAAILYTSGSTGKPKGVMLSHRNLFLGADSVVQYLALSEEDRLLCVLPFSFDAGLNQLISAFKVGATAVLLDHLFAKEVVTAIETHQITGLGAVPPLWIQLADLDLSGAAKSLRFISNTGGRMPKTVLEKLRAQLPQTRIYLMYGLTEAFRSAYLDPALVDARPDSVGKAIPHAVLRIVQPDGRETAAGETGELVHAGALVAKGYWNDAERTAQRFRPAPDCFPDHLVGTPAVFSGDSFVRDADGFLYFVGRDDEMIKTSGYRVSPTEIEEALYATGEVVEAVATGIADVRMGAVIAVAIVLKPNTQGDISQIQQKLRDVLPGYMQPKHIDVWADFPRSPNGKLDRVEITRALTEKLRQDAA